MKYEKLAELKAAFDSGELNPKTCRLILDSDCSVVLDENDEEIYMGPGRYDIWEEALDLLGIPWQRP